MHHCSPRTRLFAAACAAWLVGLHASEARAEFNAADGKVTTPDALATLGFDDPSSFIDSALAPTLYDFNGGAITGEALRNRFVGADDAIEGDGAVAAGGRAPYLYIDLPQDELLRGARVEVVFWQRPRGTRLTGSVQYYGGDLSAEDSYVYLGQIQVQPTGAVTDDGWEEWTTGPFDFAWAGIIAPLQLALYDEQLNGYYGGQAYDADADALIDGVAVLSHGDARIAGASCTALNEATTCGDGGVCHYGLCADAAVREGQPLLDAQMRADYLDRHLFEIDKLEGGRASHDALADIAALFESLKSETSPSVFWREVRRAYTLLHDGHASAPFSSYPAYVNAGICMHQGEADLIDGAPIVPLVFHLPEEDNAISSALQIGDALVQIDGVDVGDWVAAMSRLVAHHGDPAGFSVVTAPTVLAAAIDTGATLTFARCAGPEACAQGTEQLITVDTAALFGSAVIDGSLDAGLAAIADCDYRFSRPVDDPDSTDYDFVGHVDDGDVRTLVINGVPGSDGRQNTWTEGIEDAFDNAPANMIIDERQGGGGTVEGVDLILGPLFTTSNTVEIQMLPWMEGDFDDGERDALIACSSSGESQFPASCGNTNHWLVGKSGSTRSGVASNTKLAVLIGNDVSGNDFLTRALPMRDAETRIFGAGATHGAIGVIWSMPGYFGEQGGSLQTEDSIFLTDANDPTSSFETSTGVVADDGIYQKQSDALLGKDTLLEAARAWLSAE